MASRSLSDLTPAAREKALRWVDACKAEGIDVLVYCTYRDAAEQNELYAIGRTKPGKRVTNARGGNSIHQYRCAWDAVPLVHGKPAWNDLERYKTMAKCAKALGIEWAGDWVSFKEQAHFQYTGGLTLADLKAGKVIA